MTCRPLFDLIDRGRQRYGVPAYNGGLFDPEAHAFLAGNGFRLVPCAHPRPARPRPQPDRPDLGLFRVDYRDLRSSSSAASTRDCSDFKPQYARRGDERRPDAPARSRAGAHLPVREPVPQRIPSAPPPSIAAGTIYLETDKGERRKTGSYYTPDHIVNHMVEAALGPLCSRIEKSFGPKSTRSEPDRRAPVRKSGPALSAARCLHPLFDDRVLTLRILDPAMGSAHFLIRACQYLAEEIATNPSPVDPGAEAMQSEASTITYLETPASPKLSLWC